MFCIACGRQMNDEERFCSQCGTRRAVIPTDAPAATIPAPPARQEQPPVAPRRQPSAPFVPPLRSCRFACSARLLRLRWSLRRQDPFAQWSEPEMEEEKAPLRQCFRRLPFIVSPNQHARPLPSPQQRTPTRRREQRLAVQWIPLTRQCPSRRRRARPTWAVRDARFLPC